MVKGHEVFKPLVFLRDKPQEDPKCEARTDECNTTLHGEIRKMQEASRVPEWVNHIRTDDDGRRLGFERKPHKAQGYWQGGGRWLLISR